MASCLHSTPIPQNSRRSSDEPAARDRGSGGCTLLPPQPVASTDPEFESEWGSLDKAPTCTLSRRTTTDAATTTEETIEQESLEMLSVPDVSFVTTKLRVASMAALNLERDRSRYRRRLTSRLVCAFCVLLFVAIAVCLACVAMLLHVEPSRGVLVAVEGSLEMIPKSSSYCVRGNPAVISAYKSDTVQGFENALDSIYGNMSVASRYAGSLVEDLKCLLRPGRESVSVEMDFTLFWRRRRNRYGTLSAYPDAREVADSLHAALASHWLAGFRVDPDSIVVGDSRTIA